MNILLFVFVFISILASVIFSFTAHSASDYSLNEIYSTYIENRHTVYSENQRKQYLAIECKQEQSETKKSKKRSYPNRKNKKAHDTFNLALVLDGDPFEKELCRKILHHYYPKLKVDPFIKEMCATIKDTSDFSLGDLLAMKPPFNNLLFHMIKEDFEDYFVFEPIEQRKPLIFPTASDTLLSLVLPPIVYQKLIDKEAERKANNEKRVNFDEFKELIKECALTDTQTEHYINLFAGSAPPKKVDTIESKKKGIKVKRIASVLQEAAPPTEQDSRM